MASQFSRISKFSVLNTKPIRLITPFQQGACGLNMDDEKVVKDADTKFIAASIMCDNGVQVGDRLVPLVVRRRRRRRHRRQRQTQLSDMKVHRTFAKHSMVSSSPIGSFMSSQNVLLNHNFPFIFKLLFPDSGQRGQNRWIPISSATDSLEESSFGCLRRRYDFSFVSELMDGSGRIFSNIPYAGFLLRCQNDNLELIGSA